MVHLKRASEQLFSRPEDERFDSFEALQTHCERIRDESNVRWQMPNELRPCVRADGLGFQLGSDGEFRLNDWSFSQSCGLAGVKKETVNRLSADTASRVLTETLPGGSKPMQLLTRGDRIRAVHGASYTRLFDAELLETVRNVADDFGAAPTGFNGAAGFYAGEQDMFAFLVDDSAWVDIGGEQFAPGFFVWNSEVGRRTVGVETFWFQRICANHIVWDAVEVVSYSRKHTARVNDAVDEIRSIIGHLVEVRDRRKDAFARTIRSAMTESLGSDQEEVIKALSGHGVSMSYVKQAVTDLAEKGSSFTVFNAVDALTRIAGRVKNAGERAAQDMRIGSLLSLAS